VRRFAVSLAAAVAGILLSSAQPAAANGRFPASNQLLFAPSDPNLVVLRTTFGVLLSHDAGLTWQWLCEDAIGLPPNSTDDPTLAVTANGSIVAGTYKGLEVSHDSGCNWSFLGGGLAKQLVTDVSVRRDAPHTAVAVTSTYGPNAGADGGAGYTSQVYQSTDDGATWAPLGTPIDPSVLTTTIDLAPSDPHRIYVAGFRLPAATGSANTPILLVSVDDGMHWAQRALPPLVNETADYIAGVDPGNADWVYVRSQGAAAAPTQSRLFVTTDAGQSFQVALTFTSPMLGFALSADGAKVYAGSPADGLLVAARASVGSPGAFHQTSAIHVNCLATHGTELWACSDEASQPVGFIAGTSTDDGATFTPRLHLDGIQSALACTPNSTAAQCSGVPFQQLCESLGGCAGWDAGADGSADAGMHSSPTKGSCGCAAASGGGAAGLLAVTAVGVLAVRRRRKA
jgi:MYXO-CTERM domain-containing protein